MTSQILRSRLATNTQTLWIKYFQICQNAGIPSCLLHPLPPVCRQCIRIDNTCESEKMRAFRPVYCATEDLCLKAVNKFRSKRIWCQDGPPSGEPSSKVFVLCMCIYIYIYLCACITVDTHYTLRTQYRIVGAYICSTVH